MPEDNGAKRNPDGTFAEGNTFSTGRPKGSVSIIGKIKQIWEENPEQFQAYVAEVMKDPKLRTELIRQVDGAPKQSTDITSGGQPISIQISEAIAVKNNLHAPHPSTDTDSAG